MRGRIIAVRDLVTRDEWAWRDLANRAIEPNPVYEPDCIVPAARHQSFGSEIAIVVAEDGDGFHACMPIRRLSEWYDIPLPVVANKVRRSTYVGTPLVDDTDAHRAMATIFKTLADERRNLGYRLLGIDSLRNGGPVTAHVMAAAEELGLARYVREDFERGFVVRRDDPSYFEGHSKMLEIRRKRRRLAEEFGGDLQLVDRSQDPEAPREFVALEAAGYKADTVALANTPGEPAYFVEMCERFATAKRLSVLSLEGAGRTLAMLFWLRGGPGFLQIKVAYDERYARFSPGTHLNLDAFDFFHNQTDAEWIDSCASPNNEHLLRLFPDRTRISTVLFSLKGPIDAIAVKSLPSVRRVHSVATRLRSRKDTRTAP